MSKIKLSPILQRLHQPAPMLVASLDGDDLSFLLEEARDLHADLVEIRVDLWGSFLRDDLSEKLKRFKDRTGIPMLISFRGGHPLPAWWQPIHWRSLVHASLIDVEWNPKYPWKEIVKSAQTYQLGLIISHHDFTKTPSESALLKIASSAYSKKADLVKFATRVTKDEDIHTLMDVSRRLSAKKLVSVMGMGPMGTLTRLMAPLYGSKLVYGYIGTPTANGQLPYKELQERIRTLYPGYKIGL